MDGVFYDLRRAIIDRNVTERRRGPETMDFSVMIRLQNSILFSAEKRQTLELPVSIISN